MEVSKWEFYVKAEEIVDGTYAITITDDVLDHDCWPIASLFVDRGMVCVQCNLFCTAVYDLPNMEGWSVALLAEWTQYEPDMTTHPQNEHSIMKLST